MLKAVSIAGSNTGDVTLAGENYLSLLGQQITANSINLTNTNVTGTLPISRGGTNTSSFTTNGVNYFDGTSIVNGAVLVFNGTNLTCTNSIIATTSLIAPLIRPNSSAEVRLRGFNRSDDGTGPGSDVWLQGGDSLTGKGGQTGGSINFRGGVGQTMGKSNWYQTDGSTLLMTAQDNIGVSVRIGQTSTLGRIGLLPLIDRQTDAGSVGTSETDLYSDSIPANTLGSAGDVLCGVIGLNLVNSTSTKQVKLYFAGTMIFDSGALTLSASGSMIINFAIQRKDTTTVRYSVWSNTTGASTGTFASVAELGSLTLSNANILKVTGTAAGVGAANNDIVAKHEKTNWMAAITA